MAAVPLVILLFRSGGSSLGERLARRLGARARLLDLDAAERGQALVVADDRCLWQGCDLEQARLAWLEVPVFAWPQPRLAGESPAAGAGLREARALALSALAARARCVNPLGAGALAAAPLVALERLVDAGLPVADWELAPRAEQPPGAAWRDPLGRVGGYAPRAPEPGRPAWRSTAPPQAVLSCLVVGGAVVGATRAAERLQVDEVPRALGALACRAARALALDATEVEVCADGDGARVVALAAGPDLGLWDQRLEGAVERALANHLDALVASAEREDPEP